MDIQDINTSNIERKRAMGLGKFYTYIHSTGDKAGQSNRIFYVGKGKKNRAWIFIKRNKHWHNIADKNGINVTICAYWDSEQEAHEHEKFLILCFRDMGIRLANMTDGGEGMSGYSPTPETRRKISEAGKNILSQSENRINILARIQKIHGDELIQSRRKKSIQLAWLSSDLRNHQSAVAQDRWSDSEFKRTTTLKMIAAQARPEVKERVMASKKRGMQNHQSRSVLCINTGIFFEITGDAVQWLKLMGHEKATEASICVVCQGKRKTCYGYSWRYA